MARMNFQPVMTLVAIVGVILVFAYAMKNPNFKTMLSGIFQKLTGKAGTTPTPAPAPQQQQAAPPIQQQQQTPSSGGPGPITPADPGNYFGVNTGPGTRSQDPVTRAINDCAGTTGQTYLDCVNAAYPKANRARIGIA